MTPGEALTRGAIDDDTTAYVGAPVAADDTVQLSPFQALTLRLAALDRAEGIDGRIDEDARCGKGELA